MFFEMADVYLEMTKYLFSHACAKAIILSKMAFTTCNILVERATLISTPRSSVIKTNSYEHSKIY